MFNLHNKIITVIVTLIVMINYSNGFIPDKNVFLDTEKFTTEKIETCEQFHEKYSQYLINNYQYFFDGKENYYALYYDFKRARTERIHEPFILFYIETDKKLSEFKECKDNVIYFEFNQRHFTFVLKDIHFLKPVDTFVQPPELRDADNIGVVTTCKEFDDKVIQQNTSGFLIFKDKGNGFIRGCLWQGCSLNYYTYFIPAKTELLRSNPFGFYWKGKFEVERNSMDYIYQDCDNDQLNYIEYVNSRYDRTIHYTLSGLTFYNIKPKTRRLEDIQSHLLKKLSTCEQFEEYLKQDKYILDGYIYFDYIENPKKSIYYAIKVNLYGPEKSRERASLLTYKKLNSRYYGFFPYEPPLLFVGCESKVLKNDRLIFHLDSDSSDTYHFELKDLLFYDVNEPLSEGPSGIEMQYLSTTKPS